MTPDDEILCEPSTPAEPRECAFDDPAARQDLDAFGAVQALDDFQRELADLLQGSPTMGISLKSANSPEGFAKAYC